MRKLTYPIRVIQAGKVSGKRGRSFTGVSQVTYKAASYDAIGSSTSQDLLVLISNHTQ